MKPQARTAISLMLAVPNAARAVEWYKQALGATELWNLGSVVGMEIDGAPFFLAEPERDDWATPERAGATTLRVELFCDHPDAVVQHAIDAGATARSGVRTHRMPWGPHRQGGFVDPFGHIWFVGDRSPLRSHPGDPASRGETASDQGP